MKRFVVYMLSIPMLLLSDSLLAQKSKTPDQEALAQKIVRQCANVKEGQSVFISGSPRDLPLMEDIAVHVRKAGAFPMLSVTSDNLVRRMYDDVPEKYDSQVDTYGLELIKSTDAMITIESRERQGLLADIPASRLAARAKAGQEINEAMMKKDMVGVNLGNGMYPTAERAKQYGISLSKLSDIFWAGVNTDYNKLQDRGRKLTEMLASGKEVHLTTPAGTDLKFSIEGKTPHASDGVVSDSDVEEGYASSNVWLPAGEVYVATVPGSAQGKIVVEKTFYQGKEIKRLTIEFKDGKVTSMTAQSGLDPLKKLYDASSEGKDELSLVDLGINPDVAIPSGSSMIAWMPAGMVTVGIGENSWTGGTNTSSFALPLYLTNCTMKLDNTVIVENGKLKMDASMSEK